MVNDPISSYQFFPTTRGKNLLQKNSVPMNSNYKNLFAQKSVFDSEPACSDHTRVVLRGNKSASLHSDSKRLSRNICSYLNIKSKYSIHIVNSVIYMHYQRVRRSRTAWPQLWIQTIHFSLMLYYSFTSKENYSRFACWGRWLLRERAPFPLFCTVVTRSVTRLSCI